MRQSGGNSGLFSFELAATRRISQGEDNDFFTGDRANVMVKTDWSDTCDVANDFFQLGSGDLDQLRSNLFQ